jgi:hypothetical protein
MNTGKAGRSPLLQARDLAANKSTEEIQACSASALEGQHDVCELTGPPDETLQVLAKAEVMSKMIDSGLSPRDALRELGRRMRRFSQS